MNIKKIPISELFYSEAGTTNSIIIDYPKVSHAEASIPHTQKIEIHGMKIEDAVCFFVQDQSVLISYDCVRCLSPTSKKISLLNLEKQFYLGSR